jgi:hypothetical protein
MHFKWEVQTTAEGALRGNAKMKLPAAIEIPLTRCARTSEIARYPRAAEQGQSPAEYLSQSN